MYHNKSTKSTDVRNMLYTSAVQEVEHLITCYLERDLCSQLMSTNFSLLPMLAFNTYLTGVAETAETVSPTLISFSELLLLHNPERDYPLFLRTLDKMVETYESNPWLRLARARALWPIGYYQCALEDLQIANHAARTQTAYADNTLLLAMILSMIGDTYVMLARNEDAIELFSQAMRLDPTYPRVYLSRGYVYLALGHSSRCPHKQEMYYQCALIDYDCAASLEPTLAFKIQRTIRNILKRLDNLHK